MFFCSSKLRKSIFLFFIFGFSVSICFSKTSLSVTPVFGFMNGTLDEIIYRSFSDKKISLLEWEKKYFYGGGKIDFSIGNFNSKIQFTSNVHKGFGEMRDSDWLNPFNPLMKTTYSVGDVESRNNFNTEVEFSYDFKVAPKIHILPVFQFQYAFDYFYRNKYAEGWYGQSEYSSDGEDHFWYDEEAKKFPYTYYNETEGKYKTVRLAPISYYRHSYFVWYGAKVKFDFSEKLKSSFAAFYSPFSYFESLDTHFGSNTKYKMIQKNYFSQFKFLWNVNYDFTKRLSLDFSLQMIFDRISKGNLIVGGDLSSQKSSSTVTEFSSVLGLKIKLF